MSEIKLQKIKFPGLNNTYTIPIPEEVTSIEHGGTGATTAEEARNALGAAPAGYGYGEPCVSFYFTGSESVTNFENALNETLAGMLDKEAKQICVTCTGIADTTLYGTLYRHTADYAIIKLTTYYQDSSITKCKWAGKWELHSWENPPMQVGVEYRTTERYLGYPVYCYVLDFGTPADGKTMELPNKDSVYCIKLIARTSYTCGTGVTGAYTPGATFGSGSVSLRIVDSTLEGNSSYPVQVIAYYYRPW